MNAKNSALTCSQAVNLHLACKIVMVTSYSLYTVILESINAKHGSALKGTLLPFDKLSKTVVDWWKFLSVCGAT